MDVFSIQREERHTLYTRNYIVASAPGPSTFSMLHAATLKRWESLGTRLGTLYVSENNG